MKQKKETKKDAPVSRFYENGLDEPRQADFEKARAVEGLDDEIALLRIKLRELVNSDPDRLDLCLRAADTIARLVSTRHRMTGRQKQSLKEAVTKVLTEIAIPIGGAAAREVLRK